MKRRVTKQRETVYDCLYKLGHASADQVHQTINQEHPGFSLATVYRNLNVLADEGRIKRVHQGAYANYYDATTENHYHFICNRCQKIEDIDLSYMEDMNKKIKEKHQIEVLEHQIVFHGICKECQKSE